MRVVPPTMTNKVHKFQLKNEIFHTFLPDPPTRTAKLVRCELEQWTTPPLCDRVVTPCVDQPSL